MTGPAGSARTQFASDNWSGICPEAWAALAAANTGHAASYGDDPWTLEAAHLVSELFERACKVFFVFNGTAANSLAVASLCAPFESVLCADLAHLATDECNAPGFFTHGASLIPLPADHGKLRPEAVDRGVQGRRPWHQTRPAALSLTQSTELGTVYTPQEIAALTETARRHGLAVHLDGARLANAVASLDLPPRSVTWEAGVDVVSLGGTKNGLPLGEAIVFFDSELARQFAYRRKQSGQLASKMRFLSAPWAGVLRDGAWLRHASHANAMAADLERGLRELAGIPLSHPREANAVFAQLPPAVAGGLREAGWSFYSDVGPGGAARLMCSWDTRAEDVAAFVNDAVRLAGKT